MSRHQYIRDVTQAGVSPWKECTCVANRRFQMPVEFYQCTSNKGEHGFVITAHINEVPEILGTVLTSKKSLVIINSCIIRKNIRSCCLSIVKAKNTQSELFFAKQEQSDTGMLLNYVDNVGTFGFGTSESERELFRYRQKGLVKAIRMSFDKVAAE